MRLLFTITLSIVAAFFISYHLAVSLNPEIRFWTTVMQQRDKEITSVRNSSANTPILIFTGGSSTAFSIDPEVVETHLEVPTFNLGLPVAAEAKYILHHALEKAQKGDWIVISMEPDVLAFYEEHGRPSKVSMALTSHLGESRQAAGGTTFGFRPSVGDRARLLRPGVGYLVTFIARQVLDVPYRYTLDDIRYRGRIETPLKDPKIQPVSHGSVMGLSADGAMLLTQFKVAAEAKGVHVLYSIPWRYTSSEALQKCRDSMQLLLSDIDAIIQVVDDGYLGCVDRPDWFSDSPLHLTGEGAAIRSLGMAIALKPHLDQG